MRPLTSEEIAAGLNGFPRHRMDEAKKEDIYSALAAKPPFAKVKKLLPSALSFAVLFFLFAGISLFAINNLAGNEEVNQAPGVVSGTGSSEKPEHGKGSYSGDSKSGVINIDNISIDPMDKFTIKKVSAKAAEFYQGTVKVGGIEILTEKGMNKNLQAQNIFDQADRTGYQYPVKWTLDHQKTMEVSQVHHYFFLQEKSKARYHVYFYTPHLDAPEIDKIARTFRFIEN